MVVSGIFLRQVSPKNRYSPEIVTKSGISGAKRRRLSHLAADGKARSIRRPSEQNTRLEMARNRRNDHCGNHSENTKA
jgi:hypothetical protein